MGRKKIVSFRATRNEQRVIDILSERENRSPSEMIRECIREAAINRGLMPAGLIDLESFWQANHGE